MKKNIFILITGVLITLYSCGIVNPNNTVDEGKVDENIYTSEEIGWSIEIPKGWEVTTMEYKEQKEKKGYDALKEVIGDFDYNELKNLIGFKKGQFNIFQSTSEPFELEYEGEWEDNNQLLKEVMFHTFENQGIKVDTTATKIEKIDGLDFHSFSFKVFDPKGKVILTQIVYSRLINGFDFGVNINYNNDKDRDEMLNAWHNSKFKK